MNKSFKKFINVLSVICSVSFIFMSGSCVKASETYCPGNIQSDICDNKISGIESFSELAQDDIKIKHLKNILNRCIEILEFKETAKQKYLNEQFDALIKISERLQIEYHNCPWYKLFKLLDIRKNIKLNYSKLKLLEIEIYNNKQDIKNLKETIKQFEEKIVSVSKA